MSRSLILGLFVLALVGGLVALGLRGVKQKTCEVCITFEGETACRTGVGRTQEEAVRAAAESCCAVLPAGNMAERIRCSQSEPTTLVCE